MCCWRMFNKGASSSFLCAVHDNKLGGVSPLWRVCSDQPLAKGKDVYREENPKEAPKFRSEEHEHHIRSMS